MQIVKRDGSIEPVSIEKITIRLRELCNSQNIKCSYTLVVNKVASGLCNMMTTAEIDKLSAQEAAAMTIHSSEYERLAAAVTVSNLHKSTGTFVETWKLLRNAGLTSREYNSLMEKYGEQLEKSIDYNLDYNNNYNAIKTAMTVTLAKINGVIVERPQSNLMRVSLALHGHDTQSVLNSYKMLSRKMCIHGTPTHIDAGLGDRLSSCYLLNLDMSKARTNDDEIDVVYGALHNCAKISNNSGGLGFSCSSIPATGTPKKKGGKYGGLIPTLKLFDDMSDQAKNDGRKSAISPYLEVWHDDIELFIQSKLPHRKDELRCARLFPALWIPDLFMKRLLADEEWSLFCPTVAPELDNCFGKEFEALYTKYESEGRAVRKEKASYLWSLITRTIEEAGGPFILYKDTCNEFANLSHWGCIKSSNLCTEIVQYSSAEETAVCNLASVALPTCVVDGEFDHTILRDIVSQLVHNLDKVIDKCQHPIASATKSNGIHRTMAIGLSGLADTFLMLRLPFTSPAAKKLNVEIMETIYYTFLRTSCDIARERGTHPSYQGSKISQGILNYMLFNTVPTDRWPFSSLIEDIKKYGVAHGLGVGLMPTSNGSIMLGTSESFEPYSGNVYVQRIAAGEFIVINKHLERDLKKLELWIPSVKDHILKNRGSIAELDEIPIELRELYKTVWEIPMKEQAEMAYARAPWVDQSQSFSAYYEVTDSEKISNMLISAWFNKLKTGMYYMRTTSSLKADIITTSCDSCVA